MNDLSDIGLLRRELRDVRAVFRGGWIGGRKDRLRGIFYCNINGVARMEPADRAKARADGEIREGR